MNIINSQKKISVIVPIYNVENYLEKCISSILAQSYTNLEILLVDDGSTDSCSKICDNFANLDSRIIVIHKKNGGLSDARNVGIESSTGDYILFVDGDDYVSVDLCGVLLENLLNSDSDISICNFYWKYKSQMQIDVLPVSEGGILYKEEILEKTFVPNSVTMIVAWNKLYRRSLFFTKERIRYPIGILHEDEFTTFRLLYTAKKIILVDRPLYYYVQRKNSITSSFNERNIKDYSEVVSFYLRWSNEFAKEKRKLMEYVAMNSCFNIFNRLIINPNLTNKKIVKKNLITLIGKEIKNFTTNPYATLPDKTKYFLFKFGLYSPVYKFWRFLKYNKISS